LGVHEYGIASSLLRMAEEHARKHDAARVVRLEVRVGELSGVEVPLLETAWSLVRERSVCAGADLDVQCVPVRWACPRCEMELAPGARLGCPDCGVPARLEAGGELFLDRIEMEVS
jgi:hydrogenase nickel incorporation protein HypA/HybF